MSSYFFWNDSRTLCATAAKMESRTQMGGKKGQQPLSFLISWAKGAEGRRKLQHQLAACK